MAPFTGRVTTNLTIPGPHDTPACNEFYIAGRVTIAGNSTLTIHPGAVVRGIKNPSDPALILVTRGAHIKADGTTDPIILTSSVAPGGRASNDWGGLVINGVAPENIVGEGSSEGLPPGGDAVYGGDNPNALTSFMRFVRVEFAGAIIGEANELNVLTQNSLGRLSTMENLQAHHGADDCFEWFGGNVQERFLVATQCGDDALDWQIGYQGQPDPANTPLAAVQFAVVADDGNAVGSDADAHGIEADNSEFGFENQPRSAPWFCNITAVGTNATGGATNTGDGARSRRGTAGQLENSILENWQDNGIDFRDEPSTRLTIVSGTVRVANYDGNAGTASPFCAGSAGQCPNVTDNGMTSNLTGPLTGPGDATTLCDGSGNVGDRYLPSAVGGIPSAHDCGTEDPSGFFQSAPYVGAFEDDSHASNWMAAKKCCPTGTPFAKNGPGSTNCWLSFDNN